MEFRKGYLQSTYNYYVAERDKNLLDLEVYLSNPAGIGEHPNIGEEIRKKVEQIDKYDSVVSTLIARYGEEMLESEKSEEAENAAKN